MIRLRILPLAVGLVACRAVVPATPVRAPLLASVPAPIAEAPAGSEPTGAAGLEFACELRSDGSVWCWGDNTVGTLGDGTRASRAEARRVVGLDDVTQLAVGSYTVCAVTREGRVYRWGVPVDRRAPRGVVLSPEALPLGAPVAEVVVTRTDVCARRVRGGVVCRGSYSTGADAGELTSLRDAVSLVTTGSSVCARLRDGGLRCVVEGGASVEVPEGRGARAVAGTRDTIVILQPDGAVVSVATPGVIRGAVAVVEEARGATGLWGSDNGWCYARDQRLWCRGVDERTLIGGHGVRGVEPESLPAAGVRGARWATVGRRFACALAEGDDTPRCWGQGIHLFEPGDGRFEQLVPVGGAALTSAVDVVARGNASCALMEGAAPRCWGSNEQPAALGATRAVSALPVVREAYGAPVEGMAWCRAIGCAVAAGALRCTVAAARYTMVGGRRVRTPDPIMSPVLPAAARSVAITQDGVCASLADGRVTCAPLASFHAPPTVEATPDFTVVSELAEVARVVSQGGLLCALSDTRPARCWGAAMEWDMLPSQSATPVELPHLGPVRSLASGENHACAVDLRGAVWCWGRGRAGQLGSGAFSERARPARVALAGEAQEVAVGRYHTCARVGGALWCWGGNAHGQLGDGTTAMRAAPTRVAGVEGVTRVVADGDRTCAVGGDRRVYCWGAGDGHALGTGEARDRYAPTPVRGE